MTPADRSSEQRAVTPRGAGQGAQGSQQTRGAANNETLISNSSSCTVPAQPLGSRLSLIGTAVTMPPVPEGSSPEERREEKKGLSGGVRWP